MCKPYPVQDQVNPKMLSALLEGRVDCVTLSEMRELDEWLSITKLGLQIGSNYNLRVNLCTKAKL